MEAAANREDGKRHASRFDLKKFIANGDGVMVPREGRVLASCANLFCLLGLPTDLLLPTAII
jgi:hypothetical protein